MPFEHAWTSNAYSHFPTLASTAILPSSALTPPKSTQGQASVPSPVPLVWEAAEETSPPPWPDPSKHRHNLGNQKEMEFAQDTKQLRAHHGQSHPQKRGPHRCPTRTPSLDPCWSSVLFNQNREAPSLCPRSPSAPHMLLVTSTCRAAGVTGA